MNEANASEVIALDAVEKDDGYGEDEGDRPGQDVEVRAPLLKGLNKGRVGLVSLASQQAENEAPGVDEDD